LHHPTLKTYCIKVPVLAKNGVKSRNVVLVGICWDHTENALICGKCKTVTIMMIGVMIIIKPMNVSFKFLIEDSLYNFDYGSRAIAPVYV
jgi:hypothetical protein